MGWAIMICFLITKGDNIEVQFGSRKKDLPGHHFFFLEFFFAKKVSNITKKLSFPANFSNGLPVLRQSHNNQKSLSL
jgi:hypothetical protein